ELNGGVLIVDKPRGLTSQQVVSRVKRFLGVRKAGHTGTLDPLATGVLPVALNYATKIIPYLNENRKIYRVQGCMGMTTDTDDAEGRVTGESTCHEVTRGQLAKLLLEFTGTLTQVPPVFSAIKVRGRALYRYARSGEAVDVPSRKVLIYSLDLTGFEPPYFEL